MWSSSAYITTQSMLPANYDTGSRGVMRKRVVAFWRRRNLRVRISSLGFLSFIYVAAVKGGIGVGDLALGPK